MRNCDMLVTNLAGMRLHAGFGLLPSAGMRLHARVLWFTIGRHAATCTGAGLAPFGRHAAICASLCVLYDHIVSLGF